MPVVDSLLERDFFADPFSFQELNDLFKSVKIKDYFSIRSPSFKELNIQLENLNEEEVLNLMLKEPRLIRRPLIFIDGQLIIGTDKLTMLNII